MMHDSAVHLTEDELNDAADGTRSSAEAGPASRHLMHCARCRGDVDRIRELLALAQSLPRSIEPPVDLWPDIRTRVRGSGAQPTARRSGPHPRRASFLGDGRWLAAAALLLIVASSALTVLYMRRQPAVVVRGPDSAAPAAGARPDPMVRTVSDDYDRLDQELATLLAAQRAKLQPETIAKVERNLAIIDNAIAEIRQALSQDPGNEALMQLLKASYGQKSALVHQVSAS